MAHQTSVVKFVSPRHGVMTLSGYNIKVRVDRGHLTFEDGIGAERHRWRLPRVGHGLERLVVIGNEGFVSLAALRWLADQNAAFVMLERNGRVLVTTGPVRSSDARLRRAQALAFRSAVGLEIARELIDKKLAGQEQVVRTKLNRPKAADVIAGCRKLLETAGSIERVAILETQAAAEYWSQWEGLPITFPKSDLPRVREHWRRFSTRKSPISKSQRLAVDPVNSALNYLYSILEAESRLAASAVGLDPGLGFLHVDKYTRDSLACDLMEAVRPQVDAYVLEWAMGAALKREWFFENHDGNCRLMASFAAQLSQTALMWYRAVAPFAESVVRALWSEMKRSPTEAHAPTRLTQGRKREAKGRPVLLAIKSELRPERVCRVCGKTISNRHRVCADCAPSAAAQTLLEAGELSRRVLAHTPSVHARIGETQRRIAAAKANWDPASQPTWLTEEAYRARVQPLLANFTTRAISRTLRVSWPYAKDIQIGKCRPHPMHWMKLAELVRVAEEG